MNLKICSFCGVEKKSIDFYSHNGRTHSRCKECCKKLRKKSYRDNPEKHKEYDKLRYKRPERKKQIYDSLNRQHINHSEKYIARQKAKDAVKKGRINKPDRCSICGKSSKQIEAHHKDYTKPLIIMWVCTTCHRHVIHKEIYSVGGSNEQSVR